MTASIPGLEGCLSRVVGHPIRDFTYAKSKFGFERAFEGICSELLTYAKAQNTVENLPPLFDVILIDEAQDLPQQFFELVYHATAKPKRIV